MPASEPATTRHSLSLSLACDLHAVRRAGRELRRFLSEHHCAPADVIDSEIVLVEACNNAIQYAQGPGRSQPVLVHASWEPPRSIELRITDHTPGFDWPEQVALPDTESERGRGLYLIRALMAHAEYIRGTAENILVLRRLLGTSS